MIRYLLRRLGTTLLMLLGVSILLFGLSKAAPGEFLTEAKLNPQISAETIAALRSQYGLDRPLGTQYLLWLRSVARGDLGYSFAYNMAASTLLWPRVWRTLLLTIPALLISWILAVPLGTWAASKRGNWLDKLFSTSTSLMLALPDLLIALVFLLIALRSGIFPVGGMRSGDPQQESVWKSLADIAWHMVLPVLALVIGSLPTILRHVRASMIEVLDSSYIKAAEGHGLSRSTVLYHYALPAAANPLISLLGLSIAGLLSTSLLVEVIMGWPGMGPLFVEAILSRDFFVVIGAVMFSIILLGIGNLFADIFLYAADPRIRVQA
jgi:peptide/nickel transport system permease protein